MEPFKLYDRVLALIIVMYVVVIVIDQVSLRVRRRFIEDEPMRPKWKQVFLPWTDG